MTAYSLDSAVMTWGVYVENKLNERWPNGEPINSLEELLDDDDSPEKRNSRQFAMLVATVGTGGGNVSIQSDR